MRNSERVLNSLTEHSKDLNYKYKRLYRILFNEEMFYVAYQRIYAKPGNMTAGSDNQTIDNMSLNRITKLIDTLKNESYHPSPSRRTFIPKKNGKMRPLGIPSFNDKLLQEVIRMMLDAIYEGQFENSSHGFRPKRSCHTAIQQISKSFSGIKWYIEGDIKGFFDNINHDVLINILKERIEDERFIRLIRKFLNAGYVEEWTFHKTYSGTPQGGIISPILANIYLDKLDKYMNEYMEKFNMGGSKKMNALYKHYANKKRGVVEKLKVVETIIEREKLIEQVKSYGKLLLQTPSTDEMDGDYRRLKYVRYADDFLCGVIGSKEDTQIIKEDIKRFLAEKLLLELSDEKTLITHSINPAKFLGFEIRNRKSDHTKRDRTGRLSRFLNKKVEIMIPKDAIKSKLISYDVLEIKKHNGKEIWKPKSRRKLKNNDDLEILERYNSEIRGLYNYFSIAKNCSKQLSNFGYIMEYSMYKTFAAKYRTKVKRVCRKYKHNDIFTIKYKVKSGNEKSAYFYSGGFKRRSPFKNMSIDNKPNTLIYTSSTSLIDRLKAEKCELCGATERLIMHHVRKLKGLKGKENWEKHMIARRRKTVAICGSCHQKIHHGTI